MTIIKDPILEPYFLQKDPHQYIVAAMVQPKRKHYSKDELGDAYEKQLAYFPSFEGALKYIAKAKLSDKDQNYDSIQSYIDAWKEITNSITKTFNLNNL